MDYKVLITKVPCDMNILPLLASTFCGLAIKLSQVETADDGRATMIEFTGGNQHNIDCVLSYYGFEHTWVWEEKK